VYIDENLKTGFNNLGISGSTPISWTERSSQMLNTTINEYARIAMDINEVKFWNLDLCKYNILDDPYIPVSVGYMVSFPSLSAKQTELITLLDDNINLQFNNSTKNLIQLSAKDFGTYKYNVTYKNPEVCADELYKPSMSNTSGIWII